MQSLQGRPGPRAATVLAALTLAALTLAAGAAIGLATTTSADAAELDRSAVIQEVNAYLRGLKTIQGEFLQMAPDRSITEGSYAIRRPGRLDFDFAPPSAVRVIADGFWIAVIDEPDDPAIDRYPLSETPLYLFLRDDMDLTVSGVVRRITVIDDRYHVTAVDPSNESQGRITLVLDRAPIRLREWLIVDPQGHMTRVMLRTAIENERVDPRRFVIPQR